MSETHCASVVPVNTVADGSVKFQFPESMSPDPMSIHAHAAPDDGSVIEPLSVHNRRQIDVADMSETATRGTVVGLTLYGTRGRFTRSSLEFSISIAFDGSREPNT
jgi:hypothetical protein